MRGLPLSAVFALIACGSTSYEERDPSFQPPDAAQQLDGGRRDGGATVDAGTRDAGLTGDAGTSTDGGRTDAGAGVCGPLTCSGCCSAGQCKTGQLVSQCGKNGATCAACTSFERCGSAQSCEVDPMITWLAQPTAASLTHQDWDGLSEPDLKLDLRCPATRSMSNGSSPTVEDSYDPTWSTGGCTATTLDLLTGGFGFEANEVDLQFDDTVCGFTTVAITEADLRAGKIVATSPCAGLTSLTISFTKQ